MSDIITAENQLATESLFDGIPEEILSSLTPQKTRMITLYLTGLYTQTKIAKIIGVNESTIRIWLNQPAVQSVIKELQAREFALVDARLKAMRYKALDTMDDLLNSPDDRVKFSASKDILDRTGHKAAQAIKVDKTVTTIEQQLKDIVDFSIDDAEIIDIDDYIEVVKSE